jgi:hypothetical protein
MHTDSPPSGHGEDLVRFPSETIHRVTLLGAPEKGKPLRAWGVEEDSWVIEAIEDLSPRDDSDPAWEIWVTPIAQA